MTVRSWLAFFLSAVILITPAVLTASDFSEAADMRKKAEAEYAGLDVPVKNFGSSYVKRKYERGMELIRLGKVNFAQGKYQGAISLYRQYFTLQNEVYKELAAAYISRAEAIFNETAKELVDFVDNEKVGQYFRLANQNVADAKKAAAAGNYQLAIETCRTSKKYSIEAYKAAVKPVPEKYDKDIKDNNKEIFQMKLIS
jgi:hypothetical protein